jgi:DedD protein
MAKQQTEDELNLRRKARRRLIGAIALTLAVVVILPMVLDSEPKSTGNDIDLSIPDPDKAGAFVPGAAFPEVKPPSSSSTGSTPAVSGPDKGKPVVVQSQSNKAKPGKVKSPLQKSAETRSTGKQAYTEKVGGNVRVRVGPYTDRDKAEQVGHLLEKHGYHPVIVSSK